MNGRAFLAMAALVFASAAIARAPAPRVNDALILAPGNPPLLSEFGFFTDMQTRAPAARLFAYRLNTPLFSDYAEKQRYIYVPGGKVAHYDPAAVLALPIGSVLIKTFGYGTDAAFKPIETRVLLHRESGWVALPYLWNADLSDAVLKRAGARVPITVTDPTGKAHAISYAVPNQNQCKECHGLSGAVTSIGPTVRNLNDGRQLQAMLTSGMLDRLPSDAPRLAKWDDEAAPLDDRARAYLEVNCAHCHRPEGSASNSGLFLGTWVDNRVARGLGKRPVAAGRGAGHGEFAVDPGHAERSILLYRMRSTEPGVAMPELSRTLVHHEAIDLMTRWIDAMPAENQSQEKPGAH